MSELTFTKDEICVLRKANVKLDDTEFSAFLSAAQRYGLNPLANQIYVQVRGRDEKRRVTYVTQIDGYRLNADRTGLLAGNDDPIFTKEPRIMGDGDEIKASVTVYKFIHGEARPFTASARWSQYYPGKQQGFMWDKMPHLMLGKCAEALALRKAFPAELSGLYTHEEMEQAGEAVPTNVSPEPVSGPVVDESELSLAPLVHELQSVMIEIDVTRKQPFAIKFMTAEEFAKFIIEKKNNGTPLTKLVLNQLLSEEKTKAAKLRKIAQSKAEPTMRTDRFMCLVDHAASVANVSMDSAEPHVISWLERNNWTKLSLKKESVADEIWEAAQKVDWTTIRTSQST